MNVFNARFQRMRTKLLSLHLRLTSVAEHADFLAGFRVQEMVVQAALVWTPLASHDPLTAAILVIAKLALLDFFAAPRTRNYLLRTLRIVRLNLFEVEGFQAQIAFDFFLITGILVFCELLLFNLHLAPMARREHVIALFRDMFLD